MGLVSFKGPEEPIQFRLTMVACRVREKLRCVKDPLSVPGTLDERHIPTLTVTAYHSSGQGKDVRRRRTPVLGGLL